MVEEDFILEGVPEEPSERLLLLGIRGYEKWLPSLPIKTVPTEIDTLSLNEICNFSLLDFEQKRLVEESRLYAAFNV